MIQATGGGHPPKRENPTSGQAGRALENHPQSGADIMKHSTFRFSSGNSGIIQRKIIRHLLAISDLLDHANNADRLELAGTDSIRTICAPRKNPMEYISRLRAINGKDCILSVPVDAARIGRGGSVPVYYLLPVNTRCLWREALAATSAGKVQL